MDAAWAAVIGGGVGSAVALCSQFIGHDLALRRDRLNQRRERTHQVVVRAAQAIYVTQSMTNEEYEALGLSPDSIGAKTPEQVRAVLLHLMRTLKH
jgi:hypothetical protein